jgi:predicted Zn-dependent protease
VTAGAVVAALATAGFGVWTTFAGTDANPAHQPSAETETAFFTTTPTEPDISPDEVAALETAVRRDPRSPIAREALGTAYFRLRRWADAESEFRALVRLTPSDDFAHFALGRALASQGRQAEAASQFKQAESLSG